MTGGERERAEPERLERVLFVDDEHNVLDGLRRILRGHRGEWEMRFAASADEAIDILLDETIDAVVSDVNMPRRDGFELLRAIRDDARTEGVPVVILTGNGERGMKRRALDLGATDLLNKPIDPEDLVARIRSVLRLKRYQDRIKAQNQELEVRVRERTSDLERARIDLVWRLGKAGEFRDSETGFHVVRVGYYAYELANAMELGAELGRALFHTAPLHDIGKIGIPDQILMKPGKLDAAEWETMKLHTVMGGEILKHDVVDPRRFRMPALLGGRIVAAPAANPFVRIAANIAEAHHEKWDGTGYPNGLAGEEIPLEARITALADVYDALSSKRPYKEQFPEERVLAMLADGAGRHFDPAVYAAFERCIDSFREIRNEFEDEGDSNVQQDVLQSLVGLSRAG